MKNKIIKRIYSVFLSSKGLLVYHAGRQCVFIHNEYSYINVNDFIEDEMLKNYGSFE